MNGVCRIAATRWPACRPASRRLYPPASPARAGAQGRVQIGVNVTGAPAQVIGTAQGAVDLHVANPGLLGAM